MIFLLYRLDRGIIAENVFCRIRPKSPSVLFFPVLGKILLFWTLKANCPRTKREFLEIMTFLWYNSFVKEGKTLADSNITKRALAAALKELMEEKPLEKISIADICDRCEMNRKSFYYHFRDKYDLVNWIYDIEFIAIVSKKEYLSAWELLEDLCTYFYENRIFYRKAMQMEGQNSFREHFRDYLHPTLYAYLEGDIGEKDTLEFYVTFFADAYIAAIERWLLEKEPQQPGRLLELMKNCMRSFAAD